MMASAAGANGPFQDHTTSSSVVVVHDGPKEKWSIQLQPGTTTLWIGDSNSRHIQKIPHGWQVHAFPGARFSHVSAIVSAILSSISDKSVLSRIVIAVGINHRDDGDHGKYMDDLYQLHNMLLRKENVKAAINGISYPATLPGHQTKFVDQTNQWIQEAMKAAVYIPPLDCRNVNIRKGDPYGVHHDDVTVERVFRRAVSMIEGTNDLNRTAISGSISLQGNETLTNALVVDLSGADDKSEDTSAQPETKERVETDMDTVPSMGEFTEVVGKNNKRKSGDKSPDHVGISKRVRKDGDPEVSTQVQPSLVAYIKGVDFSIQSALKKDPIGFKKTFLSAYGEVDGEVRLCREDCIRLKCKSAAQLERLIKEQSLDGRRINVTGPRAAALNRKAARGAPAAAAAEPPPPPKFKGVIYDVPPHLAIEQIQQETAAVEARRLFKGNGENKLPTNSVLLTFTTELPKTVSVGMLSFRVKLLVAPVLICGRCLRYGHHRAQCRAKQRCARCAGGHGFERCPYQDQRDKACCASCYQSHPTTYKGCSKYKEVSKALLISAKAGVPFRDALLEVRQRVAERETEQPDEQRGRVQQRLSSYRHLARRYRRPRRSNRPLRSRSEHRVSDRNGRRTQHSSRPEVCSTLHPHQRHCNRRVVT